MTLLLGGAASYEPQHGALLVLCAASVQALPGGSPGPVTAAVQPAISCPPRHRSHSDPRGLSYMASPNMASILCLALGRGGTSVGAGAGGRAAGALVGWEGRAIRRAEGIRGRLRCAPGGALAAGGRGGSRGAGGS
jgi:hypothetical protein